eukprot:m.268077 g.268077  ORF g.268077 m.268077 type:complete len:1001 (+) comp16253_c1_seq22:110-3112(+)
MYVAKRISLQSSLLLECNTFAGLRGYGVTSGVSKCAAKAKSLPTKPKGPLTGGYNPDDVQVGLYSWWLTNNYFRPALQGKPANLLDTSNVCAGTHKDTKFVMMLPPPNVTGILHMGHALTVSIQDTLARWHRMQGIETMWLPGYDHAGIATQTVVENQLKEKGLTRHMLGRTAFTKAVWKWKGEKVDSIYEQFCELGCSLDWSRKVFTMDSGFSSAVTEAFVQLYDKGLITRRKRLVNWCCTLRSAISDIEVDSMQVDGPTRIKVPGYNEPVTFGVLHKCAFQVANSEGETSCMRLSVATTRPETILGDVAVAVHSQDKRYEHLHGGYVLHPLSSQLLPIIIDDELVDPSFGTGVVKITPAHDENDFAAAKRHGLHGKSIIDESGLIDCPTAPNFHKMPRFEARNMIIEYLKEKDLYMGASDHNMVLSICSRSGDVIEPRFCSQWYLDCKDMSKKALEAVHEKRLEIIPTHMERDWRRWLENIQDWCISRQLWWGHQIPAYKVQGMNSVVNGELSEMWVVGRNEGEARERAAKQLSKDPASIDLVQDEDVLDTWFSSGLFPFASLGWPNTDAEDFKQYYPGNIIETGNDILFFWVARMVMLGQELTDTLPFRQVYLHGMVRDGTGKKMSKSLGNVIDPMDVIHGIDLATMQQRLDESNLSDKEKNRAKGWQKKQYPNGIMPCGADALRLTFIASSGQGKDLNLDMTKFLNSKAFCNKIWNALKFATAHFHGNADLSHGIDSESLKPTALQDKWILNRLAVAIQKSNKSLRDFNFPGYYDAFHDFWLDDLCDVYIELAKPILLRDKENSTPLQLAEKEMTLKTLHMCIETGLLLLAPVMPYISEHLYQHLPWSNTKCTSIFENRFPEESNFEHYYNTKADESMSWLIEVCKAIRSIPLRQLNPKANSYAHIVPKNAQIEECLRANLDVIKLLSRAKHVRIENESVNDMEKPSMSHGFITCVCPAPCHVFLRVEGEVQRIEVEREIIRLQKKSYKQRRIWER